MVASMLWVSLLLAAYTAAMPPTLEPTGTTSESSDTTTPGSLDTTTPGSLDTTTSGDSETTTPGDLETTTAGDLETTTLGECVYENVTYPEGEFRPYGPCWPCRCGQGVVMCPYIVYDCVYGCADFVALEDQCCPVCPNGRNCMAPNGTILPMGEIMEMPNGDVCFCPNAFSGFFTIPYATCFPPPPTIPPDMNGGPPNGPNPPNGGGPNGPNPPNGGGPNGPNPPNGGGPNPPNGGGPNGPNPPNGGGPNPPNGGGPTPLNPPDMNGGGINPPTSPAGSDTTLPPL